MASRKLSELKDRKNVLYVALTRAVEGLIVIRKPKDSIFDELAMEVMSVGEIQNVQSKDTHVIPEFVKGNITISNYGTQVVATHEEEEEKDHEAILFGTALHYTLEMLGDFDEVGLASAMTSLQNRYGQLLS